MDDMDDEDMAPEEHELISQMIKLKEEMEERRKAVGDTDFVKITEEIPDLGRLKFKMQRQLRGHLAKVNDLGWSDSQLLVSASQDGKLIVWDAHSGNKLHMIPLRTAWVIGCGFSSTGDWVASGGLDNIVSMFRVDQRETPERPNVELHGHEGYVSSIKFIPENGKTSKLLTASGDKTIGLWDISRSTLLNTYLGHNNDVTAVAVSLQNPNTPVSVSTDKTARLWDLRMSPTKACVQIFFGHSHDINGVCFFPQASFGFVTASDDNTCRLWDVRADQEIASYCDEYIQCGSTCCALSHSGRLLVAGYDDFNCHVWDLLREERVGIMPAHEDRVSCVYLSPDGVAVATAAWDSNCLIWTAK